jgi:hypothetical protein
MENVDQASCNNRFPEFGGRRRTLGGRIILLAFVLGGTIVLFAQHSQDSTTPQEQSKSARLGAERQASSDKNENWRAEPSCFDQATGMAGRAPVSRTWVLMSPDGLYGAYAVNEAVATRSADGEISGCKSTSKLFVTGPGREKAEAVLVMEPSEDASGNSIELIDWSPEGHRLLVMEGFWAWASDAGGTTVRIYDADSKKLSSESLVDEAFRKYVGRDCVAVFQAVGFSSSGKAIVTAEPYFDVGEDRPREDSCIQKKGLWLIDSAIPAISQLPDSYKIQRYGKDAPCGSQPIGNIRIEGTPGASSGHLA